MLHIVAQTTLPATNPAERPPSLFILLEQFGPLILIGVVFYFFMSGSKRKQEKQRKSMLDDMKKGLEVVTIGGQVGKVVEVKDDRVLLKVDETSNTKIWFLRSAIHRVLDEEKNDSK